MKLYTHLNFGGNCEEAFLFYEKYLGGKITAMMKQNQLPSKDKVPRGMEDAVIHPRIDLAGVELIGNDVPPKCFQPIRSSYLCFALDSTERADKTWKILQRAAKSRYRSQKRFSQHVLGSCATSSVCSGRSFIRSKCRGGKRWQGIMQKKRQFAI